MISKPLVLVEQQDRGGGELLLQKRSFSGREHVEENILR